MTTGRINQVTTAGDAQVQTPTLLHKSISKDQSVLQLVVPC
jgi:hypothetical protein